MELIKEDYEKAAFLIGHVQSLYPMYGKSNVLDNDEKVSHDLIVKHGSLQGNENHLLDLIEGLYRPNQVPVLITLGNSKAFGHRENVKLVRRYTLSYKSFSSECVIVPRCQSLDDLCIIESINKLPFIIEWPGDEKEPTLHAGILSDRVYFWLPSLLPVEPTISFKRI